MPTYTIPIIHNKTWTGRKYRLSPGVLAWNDSMTESTWMESPESPINGWDKFRDNVDNFLRHSYFLHYSYSLPPSRIGITLIFIFQYFIIRCISVGVSKAPLAASVIFITVVAFCISCWLYPRWNKRWKGQFSIQLESFETESQTQVTLDEEWTDPFRFGEPKYSIIIRQPWLTTINNTQSNEKEDKDSKIV
jgi:hypothetical protein